METRLINKNERKLWNDFVLSQNGSILQSFDWGEVKANAGWQPIRIALFDNKNIVACISLLKKNLPIIKKSLFYAPRGPILSSENYFDALLSAVKKEAEKHKAVALKIDPCVPEDGDFEQLLRQKGFLRKKKQIQPRSTYYIDLTKNEDELMKSFEEKTRYNIRLSARKGVDVRLENSDLAVKKFCDIYHETASRDNFLIHPDSYYENIKINLIDKGLASLFIAYYQEKPIAGVFIFTFAKKIWYMYGASSNEFRNVMPNHALHWHVIKWAKENGYELYDLWGIPSNPTPGHPLFGVYRFKKGFNGKLVKYIGVYDLPFNKFWYYISDKGFVLLKNIVSLIKKGKIEDSLAE